MRSEVKEALDKIVCETCYDPNKLEVTSAESNNVRITYTNEFHCQVDFMYSDGELFVCADGRTMN